MKQFALCAAILLSLTLTGCTPNAGSASSGAFTISPSNTISLQGLASQSYSSTVNGTYVPATWTVNGISGGNSTIGTITSSGVYTAPQFPPTANTVTIAATNGTSTASTTATLLNPTPTITSVSPSFISVGAFSITVNGTNFAQNATLSIGSLVLTTTYVSSTKLTATGTALYTQVGTVQATVTNPNPGTVASAQFPVSIFPQVALTAQVVYLPALPSLTTPPVGQTIWYVSSFTGRDTNNGTSSTTAFLTIAKAISSYSGGDIIVVLPGTYNENVTINKAGTTGSYTTLMGMPGQAMPLITGSNGINILTSYVRISGVNASGTASNAINANMAPTVDGSGVSHPTVHHIIIDNNIAHDASCAGITIVHGDYFIVWGNTTYNNAFTAPNQCSGMGTGFSVDYDLVNNQPNVYHEEFINNINYGNFNKVPINYTVNGVVNTCPVSQPNCHSDGNGLIVDTNNVVNYTGKVLIFGNVSYMNGGRGIEVLASNNVDVINNSTYSDGIDTNLKNYPTTASEYEVYNANNVNLVNNIAYAPGTTGGLLPYSLIFINATNALWRTGLYNNGPTSITPTGAANIDTVSTLANINPSFVTLPASTTSPGNFRLNSTSPAIGIGAPLGQPMTDITGKAIGAYVQPNLGAYQ